MRVSAVLLAALSLSACATTVRNGPTDVIRYHLGEPLERGTVVVQPSGDARYGSALSSQAFVDAAARQLGTVGYIPAAPGGTVRFIATVDVRRGAQEGPPRPSPFSIGIGGGGFSGGRRGGGIGIGGGVGFPIGAGKRTQILSTEMTVTIKRRVDQSPVWEGHARTVGGAPEADAVVADKLARALFTGFPGESGRTITVR
jgi:hypothetical protein